MCNNTVEHYEQYNTHSNSVNKCTYEYLNINGVPKYKENNWIDHSLLLSHVVPNVFEGSFIQDITLLQLIHLF